MRCREALRLTQGDRWSAGFTNGYEAFRSPVDGIFRLPDGLRGILATSSARTDELVLACIAKIPWAPACAGVTESITGIFCHPSAGWNPRGRSAKHFATAIRLVGCPKKTARGTTRGCTNTPGRPGTLPRQRLSCST